MNSGSHISSDSVSAAMAVGGGATPDDMVRLLDRLRRCMEPVLTATAPLVRRIRDLGGRLHKDQLQVAVLGQFKRGKSTFINALLGEAVLPAGVLPLTAIPTFIAWKASPTVRITYRDGRASEEWSPGTAAAVRDELFKFVAEEANPKNRRDVARVDLFYPADLLQDGIVLIDTPGIGSTHRHNTETALATLPECDVAVFVVSADPPITEIELDYLRAVRSRVARLFVVLAKTDSLAPDDIRACEMFLHRTLREAGIAWEAQHIYCVSSVDALRGKKANDASAVRQSGIGDLEHEMFHRLSADKAAALRQSLLQKASTLAGEAEADLAFRLRTLEMPLDDLNARGAALGAAVATAQQEGRVIHDLLAGDRRRMGERLEGLAEELRQEAREHLGGALASALAQANEQDPRETFRSFATEIVPDFFDEALRKTTRQLEAAIDVTFESHGKRIDDLVDFVRRTAADLFDIPHAVRAKTERFALERPPYWVTQRPGAAPPFAPPRLFQRLLSPDAQRERRRAHLDTQMAELVVRNVEQLRWALVQSLDGAFRRLATMLDDQLVEAVDATQGAAAAAARTRTTTESDTQTERDALRRAYGELASIRSELTALQSTSGQ